MRTLLRPAPLFLLLTYLAVSAVPFVPMLLGKPLERPWQVLGVAFVGWLAAWAIFKRPAWFHWLLIPAFVALPAEVYLITYYGQGISTHHLGIIAETSPEEALDFLGNKVWLMLAVMAGIVVWWVASWSVARSTRALDWNDGSRPVVLIALAICVAVWAYGHKFGIAPATAKPGHTGWKLPPLAPWARLPFEFDAFAQSWPFGLVARGVDYYKERTYLAELGQRSANFHFGARQQEPDSEPEIVVLVIGESARADRWSLNGYGRDTNPLLSRQANVVNLPDVVTAVSATRLSVPVIISRKPAMQSLKDGFAEKSFITAYKEAGFKTFWLSNQISFGKFDTPVSVFAKEANVIEFVNLGGFTDRSNYDEVLLRPFGNALADRAPKKLIVIHSMGSHWNYSHRYPKQFDQWQPSLFGVAQPAYTDIHIKPQLNNSYDSSILYTDWFLAQLIDRLKGSQQRTSMLYVADHGQTLYDKSCKLAFHGHNTKYEFHVPAFVWYSDQYQAHYPGKVEQLQRNRKAKLATENMFHTLLDLGGIHYPGERVEWSFVNPGFKQHKRYVDSYGWADYDNAVMKGDCREVIGREKPLKREN